MPRLYCIDMQEPRRRYGKTLMFYLGQPIGASDCPNFAAARWLLANTEAKPDDIVATYRGNKLSMSGKIGECAKWTVVEKDKGGLQWQRWRPFADAAVASDSGKEALPGISGYPSTSEPEKAASGVLELAA